MGAALLNDNAAVHENYAVGNITGKRHFVGYNNHRSALFGKRADNAKHLACKLRVKRAGWLIEAKHIGGEGKRAGDCNTLLLTA